MYIINLLDEDIVNYKKISMTIGMPFCDFKCNRDANRIVCQNIDLRDKPYIEIPNKTLVARYMSNPITSAIVFQGLEPFYKDDKYDCIADIFDFIDILRDNSCMDDIVIYTGYTEDEVISMGIIDTYVSKHTNIIIKYGRYIDNDKKHLDPILGVYLASSNQYAKKY